MATPGGFLLIASFLVSCMAAGAAEPGSGIVVDLERQVWFTDSGTGVWRLNGRGEMTLQFKHPAQWLGFDSDGRYAHSKPEFYQRITPKGVNPSMLGSTSGPIAIGPEGDVYYAASNESGPLHILRLSPKGERFVVAQVPDNTKGKKLRKVNGIAVGSDNAIYIVGNHTIRKVTKAGVVSTVAGPLASLPDCAPVPGLKKGWQPYMRSITLDNSGLIYAAATGCGLVLRVSPEGQVSTILQSEKGWAPTGVAMFDRDLYVLEYQNAGSDSKRQWVPRVRKLATDGKVTVLGTVARTQ